MPESQEKEGYYKEQGKSKLHHYAFCRQEAVPVVTLAQQ